jgi:hypothetical protein
LKHGRYGREFVEQRREISLLLRDLRELERLAALC